MAVPSSLLRVPVEMPNRSGHNMSHSNAFSGKTGELIPVLCEELLPNDTVSLGNQLQVQLPPMVSDFYGRVDFVLEAFFVPNRLCWGGWQEFITHPTNMPVYPDGTPVQGKPQMVPYFANRTDVDIQPDWLLHYLDYGSSMRQTVFNNVQDDALAKQYGCSVLPVIAYHRIWDDWYRDSRVQAPLFYKSMPTSRGDGKLQGLPYLSNGHADGAVISISWNQSFDDGVGVHQLRQRNWVKDYFTSASPLPQAGGASEVEFDTVSDVVTGAGTGAFSIATLRAANSLQKWMERNNLAGYRYSDQIYAQFGIYPSDAIMDRPLYLGRSVQTVYNRTVFDTTPDSLATKGANSQALGEGSLVDSFTASEHGFLMVLASLVPRPTYGSGTERRNFRLVASDFPFPLLAGMGDQAILARELNGHSESITTYGYTDLYAECKFRNDKTHGLLRDGQNLSSFALQRSFIGLPEISSSFLQIPTDYLDQVQAVATSVQGYTYWAEIYFPFKKISTIPSYSQPTLADLKNAHTEYISRGGKRL